MEDVATGVYSICADLMKSRQPSINWPLRKWHWQAAGRIPADSEMSLNIMKDRHNVWLSSVHYTISLLKWPLINSSEILKTAFGFCIKIWASILIPWDAGSFSRWLPAELQAVSGVLSKILKHLAQSRHIKFTLATPPWSTPSSWTALDMKCTLNGSLSLLCGSCDIWDMTLASRFSRVTGRSKYSATTAPPISCPWKIKNVFCLWSFNAVCSSLCGVLHLGCEHTIWHHWWQVLKQTAWLRQSKSFRSDGLLFEAKVS